MEFAHVGAHCFFENCKQQDFLPFECEFCHDIHCASHRRPDDHKCREGGLKDDNFVIICPVCQARISMVGHLDSSPDTLWNKHVDSGACIR